MTSHSSGLRQRRKRWKRAAQQRSAARPGVHHDQVQSGTQRPRCRGRAKPSAARCRPGRPVPRPLAPRRPALGLAGDAARSRAGIRPFHRHLQRQRPRIRRGDRRRDDSASRQPSPIQFAAIPARATRHLPATERRARGLQPPRDRPPPLQRDGEPHRAARSAYPPPRCSCAGAFSTVFPSSPSRPTASESTKTRKSWRPSRGSAASWLTAISSWPPVMAGSLGDHASRGVEQHDQIQAFLEKRYGPHLPTAFS
jgi:hypothetical protein